MKLEILQDSSKSPPYPFRIKVETLMDLATLAEQRRSVVVPTMSVWEKPRPAAFLLRLPGWELFKLFNAGIYLYEKGRGIWLESLKYYQS